MSEQTQNPFKDVEGFPGNPFTPLAYHMYGEAAKQAALYELKCRLLANRDEAQQKVAFENFEIVENFILSKYMTYLRNEDHAVLTKARKIRNKLLHSDFPALFSHLHELASTKLEEPQTWILKLDSGETKRVRDTAKNEGGIFGWLLEAHASGALETAWQVLFQAREIIDRISHETAWSGVKR